MVGQRASGQLLPEPARITLRLLGLLLLVVSATCLVLIWWPGPAQIAEMMGRTCANDRHGTNYRCIWVDAVSVLWTVFWVSFVSGVALRILTRARGRGPVTVDLRRWRRS